MSYVTQIINTESNPVPVNIINQQGTDSNTISKNGGLKPYPPRLNLIQNNVGDDVKWLSADGKVLYGRSGGIHRQLKQSTDEWATRVNVGEPFPHNIEAVRDLEDGQLLVSIAPDPTMPTPSKVFKSENYDRQNPSGTTFKEVLVSLSTATINNMWGISVYNEIVVVGEYGAWGSNGARYVYLSMDFGENFTTIFDLKETVATGRPTFTETAHVHTACYDPYYNWIWVAVGDRPNSAVYYTDNMGRSWKYIQGSSEYQFTGIMPLPDLVVFGSDSHGNGLHAFRRGNDRTAPVKIEPLFLINDNPLITHVFSLPYKRDYKKGRECYFPATVAVKDNSGASVIVGFADDGNPHVLYETEFKFNDQYGFRYVLGPTAQGNIFTNLGNMVLKGKAPSWE